MRASEFDALKIRRQDAEISELKKQLRARNLAAVAGNGSTCAGLPSAPAANSSPELQHGATGTEEDATRLELAWTRRELESAEHILQVRSMQWWLLGTLIVWPLLAHGHQSIMI